MYMGSAASGCYTGKQMRLDQSTRNHTCGDGEHLLVVIRLGAAGLGKTGFVCFQDVLEKGEKG